MRFGIEVLKSVRGAVGEDFPVLVRVNGNDLMEGGIGRENMIQFAKKTGAGCKSRCLLRKCGMA